MKTTVMIPTQMEQITAVKCNCCGEDIGSALDYGNYVSVDYTGGYASKLGDGYRFEFELCETCVDKFMKTFKIPPKEDERY